MPGLNAPRAGRTLRLASTAIVATVALLHVAAPAAAKLRQRATQLWYTVQITGHDSEQDGGMGSQAHIEDDSVVAWRARSLASILFRYPRAPAKKRHPTLSDYAIKIGLTGQTTHAVADRGLISDRSSGRRRRAASAHGSRRR